MSKVLKLVLCSTVISKVLKLLKPNNGATTKSIYV